MSIEIMKDPIGEDVSYQVRCTDESCRKFIKYNKSDIKKRFISIGGGRDKEPYIGISCPACAQVIKKWHLSLYGRKIQK